MERKYDTHCDAKTRQMDLNYQCGEALLRTLDLTPRAEIKLIFKTDHRIRLMEGEAVLSVAHRSCYIHDLARTDQQGMILKTNYL